MDYTLWIVFGTLVIDIVSKLLSGRATQNNADATREAVVALQAAVAEIKETTVVFVKRFEGLERRVDALETESGQDWRH